MRHSSPAAQFHYPTSTGGLEACLVSLASAGQLFDALASLPPNKPLLTDGPRSLASLGNPARGRAAIRSAVARGLAECDTIIIMQGNEKGRRKRTKKEHAAIFDAIRGVIHQWDPYRLLAGGCPSDEFDVEIQAVARQVDKIGSPQDAVYILSCVFSRYFEPERFRPQDCQAVGERLYKVLQERGILAD